MLEIIHGFLCEKSYEDCSDIIEAYAVRGGDGGLTRKTIRMAAGLPVLDDAAADSGPPTDAGVGVTDGTRRPFNPVEDHIAERRRRLNEVVHLLLVTQRDLLTVHVMTRTPKLVPHLERLKPGDRKAAFEKDATDAGWVHIDARLGIKDAWVPVLPMEGNMSSLCPMDCTMTDEHFPELFDLEALRAYSDGDETRAKNIDVLVAFHDRHIVRLTPARGRVSEAADRDITLHKEARDKLLAHESAIGNLITLLESKDAPEHRIATAEGRSLIKIMSTYSQRFGQRSRRYVNGMGAQSLSRAALGVACANTIDLDIVNCAFTLIPQMIDRLGLKYPSPIATLPSVRQVATFVWNFIYRSRPHIGVFNRARQRVGCDVRRGFVRQ